MMYLFLFLMEVFPSIATLKMDIQTAQVAALSSYLLQLDFKEHDTSRMIGHECAYQGWYRGTSRITLCTALDSKNTSRLSYFNH